MRYDIEKRRKTMFRGNMDDEHERTGGWGIRGGEKKN